MKMIVWKKQRMRVAEFASLFGISASNVHNRLKRGMSLKDIAETPVGKQGPKPELIRGKSRSQIAKELGVSISTLTRRLQRGWNVKKAISKKKRTYKRKTK